MLAAGTIVDARFEILKMLGRGGFGEVYLARHVQLERKVALKLLKQDIADEDAIKRFDREAKILSQLQHPNIAMFVAFGEWTDYRYTALEFVEGEPLSAYLLRKGALSSSRTVQLARHLLEALAHAHKHEVIHRDLKPGNVIVNNDFSTIKLIDFGLAQIFAKQRLTQEGLAVGTVQYMSPEQCKGLPVDERSDLYSVGCILYECLTGEPAFVAEDAVAVIFMQMNESRKLFAKGNEGIALFVNKLLEKDPNNRFNSAEEALQQLQKIQVNDDVQPIGKHQTETVVRGPRNSTIPIVACAVALAIIGAIACYVFTRKPELAVFDFGPRLPEISQGMRQPVLQPIVDKRLQLVDNALLQLNEASEANRPILQDQIDHELLDICERTREEPGMNAEFIKALKRLLLLPWPGPETRYTAARYVGMIDFHDPDFERCATQAIKLFTTRNEQRDCDCTLGMFELMVENRVYFGDYDEAHKYAEKMVELVRTTPDNGARKPADEIWVLKAAARRCEQANLQADAKQLLQVTAQIEARRASGSD